jgi:hypothetical protein
MQLQSEFVFCMDKQACFVKFSIFISILQKNILLHYIVMRVHD